MGCLLCLPHGSLQAFRFISNTMLQVLRWDWFSRFRDPETSCAFISLFPDAYFAHKTLQVSFLMCAIRAPNPCSEVYHSFNRCLDTATAVIVSLGIYEYLVNPHATYHLLFLDSRRYLGRGFRKPHCTTFFIQVN